MNFLHAFNGAGAANRAARYFLAANPGATLNSLKREVITVASTAHTFAAVYTIEDAQQFAGRRFQAIMPDFDWSPDEGVIEYLRGLVRDVP